MRFSRFRCYALWSQNGTHFLYMFFPCEPGGAIKTYTHRPIVVQFIQFVFQNEPWDTSIFLFICIAVFQSRVHVIFCKKMERNGIKRKLSLLGQLLSNGYANLSPSIPQPLLGQVCLSVCYALAWAVLSGKVMKHLEKHQTIIAHHDKYIRV